MARGLNAGVARGSETCGADGSVFEETSTAEGAPKSATNT